MEAQSSGGNKNQKPIIVAVGGIAVILFLAVVALIGYAITQKNQIEKFKADLAQETQTSARLQADLAQATQISARVQADLDQTAQKASALKSELGTTTQKLQTELSRKPPLPVGVRYRQAMLGHGLVAAFRNTSTLQLLVVVEVKNPTLDSSKTFQLNLWGLPNFANEDDADQFATIMLLRSGEEGKQALYEWIQVYAEQDSRAQAANMLIAGDTHSLSVQRIRNIQASMKNSADLMSRWNNVLYPHMTSDTLKAVIANPASYDNPAAATRELAKR